MFKFYKSMKIYKESESEHVVVYQVGLKKAYAEFNHAEGELYFSYWLGHDEYLSQNIWDLSAKGLEMAIWEWLCTLSRQTTPDFQRTLGKLYLARMEAA